MFEESRNADQKTLETVFWTANCHLFAIKNSLSDNLPQVMFHLTCVHINFSSVWVVEWPPFGK